MSDLAIPIIVWLITGAFAIWVIVGKRQAPQQRPKSWHDMGGHS